MLRPNRIAKLALASAVFALAACTQPREELDDFVRVTLAKDPPALEQIPAIKQFPIHEYPEAGLRDPFSSGEDLLAEEAGGDVAADDPDCPDLTRIPEDLEQFPLDSLNMVGTMGQGGAFFGLIKDPDGVVHRVQVNNYLGQNYGQILSIAEDKIDLEERVKDGNGCERKTQSIALKDNN